MAKANLPPIKIPITLLKDQDERAYFEAINFAVYQLYQRSGGGSDLFESLQDQIDQNKLDIFVNSQNIAINAVNIQNNADDILINAGNIAQNASDILALQQTFSWKIVPLGEEVTIGLNQQMIVADGITVDGSLIIDGELSLI